MDRRVRLGARERRGVEDGVTRVEQEDGKPLTQKRLMNEKLRIGWAVLE
jgi:hypothetical protein